MVVVAKGNLLKGTLKECHHNSERTKCYHYRKERFPCHQGKMEKRNGSRARHVISFGTHRIEQGSWTTPLRRLLRLQPFCLKGILPLPTLELTHVNYLQTSKEMSATTVHDPLVAFDDADELVYLAWLVFPLSFPQPCRDRFIHLLVLYPEVGLGRVVRTLGLGSAPEFLGLGGCARIWLSVPFPRSHRLSLAILLSRWLVANLRGSANNIPLVVEQSPCR